MKVSHRDCPCNIFTLHNPAAPSIRLPTELMQKNNVGSLENGSKKELKVELASCIIDRKMARPPLDSKHMLISEQLLTCFKTVMSLFLGC